MTFVSPAHIILTPAQPVGSGRPQRESSRRLPHHESRALPTELPRPRHCLLLYETDIVTNRNERNEKCTFRECCREFIDVHCKQENNMVLLSVVGNFLILLHMDKAHSHILLLAIHVKIRIHFCHFSSELLVEQEKTLKIIIML